MQQDSQHKAQLAQYEDELARKRAADEHEKNRERNQELVGLQEQSVRKQEAEKRRIQEQIEAERRATEQYKVARSSMFNIQPAVDAATHHQAAVADQHLNCSH